MTPNIQSQALANFAAVLINYYRDNPGAQVVSVYCTSLDDSALISQLHFNGGDPLNVRFSISDSALLHDGTFLGDSADLFYSTAQGIERNLAELTPRLFGLTLH